MLRNKLLCRDVIRHQCLTILSCNQTNSADDFGEANAPCFSFYNCPPSLFRWQVLWSYFYSYFMSTVLLLFMGPGGNVIFLWCLFFLFLSLFTTQDSNQQFHMNDILYFVSHFRSSTWWGMWRAARKTSIGTPAANRRLGIHGWGSETMGITIFLQGMAVLEDAWCLG